MKVLSIILGIIIGLFGFSLLVTPAATFVAGAVALELILGVVFVIYGIKTIIDSIQNKRYDVSFAFAIISILVGLFLIFSEAFAIGFAVALPFIFAAWFLLDGIALIIRSVQLKKATGQNWSGLLVLGILSILIGILALGAPLGIAIVEGVLFALFFIEIGVGLIVAGCSND